MDRITFEELTAKVQRAERATFPQPMVVNDTRAGSYVRVQTGLAFEVYFFGFGRDSAEFMWEQLVERVG